MLKKIILVLLMAVCSVCAFAADKVVWKKFLTNNVGTEFYYNIYQKNEWYDEPTVFENTDGDYELHEDVYIPDEDEFIQKVLTKCIEHGFVVGEDKDGKYYMGIFYLGYKTDIYGNKYHTFAVSGWFRR